MRDFYGEECFCNSGRSVADPRRRHRTCGSAREEYSMEGLFPEGAAPRLCRCSSDLALETYYGCIRSGFEEKLW